MARRKQALEQESVAEERVQQETAGEEVSESPVESLEQLNEAVTESEQEAAGDEATLEQFGIEEHQGSAETEQDRVRALVEAAVYITDEPLLPAQIAAALGQPLETVQKLLEDLTAEYAHPRHGLSIRELAGGYQMATKAEHHDELRQFVKKLQPPLKLSLAALETLAVIAYKQPVTAPEILEIRGVQGAGVLKTLLDRKLIQISGRKQVLGKPALYRTTKEFLVQFGLKDLTELPTLKEFEELSRMALGDEAEVEESAEPSEAAPDTGEAATETSEAAAEAAATDERGPEPPPAEEPPSDEPGVEEPPPGEAPMEEPPAEDPDQAEPPVEEPPAEDDPEKERLPAE